MEKPQTGSEKKSLLSRRNFMALFGSAAVSAGVLASLPESDSRESDSSVVSRTPDTTVEVYDEQSHSGYFKEDVARFRTENFEPDIPAVLERLDVVDMVRTHFKLSGIPSARMRQNLETLFLGIAFEESRFDTAAISEAGAFSCVQLMPETWDDLAEEGESKESVADTVKVAARLMEQTYRHVTATCTEELAFIQTEFFAGNVDAFEHYFMTPLLANAYNAGMGTMTQLVQWFVGRFPKQEATREVFDQSELLTEYDVFIALAHTANNEQQITWYKDVATNYTCKAYAALESLQAHFKA